MSKSDATYVIMRAMIDLNRKFFFGIDSYSIFYIRLTRGREGDEGGGGGEDDCDSVDLVVSRGTRRKQT